ncbi:MAG: hypothetical protein ACK53Y_08645, partial [bacterium]
KELVMFLKVLSENVQFVEKSLQPVNLKWNALKLWNDQCRANNCQSYFEIDVIFPLSKGLVDIVSL